jgi:hypothetical protein
MNLIRIAQQKMSNIDLNASHLDQKSSHSKVVRRQRAADER